jgi:hypothetical protein
LSFIQQTCKEKELEDEDGLVNSIQSMNESFKKSKNSSSEDYGEYFYLNNKENPDLNSLGYENISCMQSETFSLSQKSTMSTENASKDAFFSQNLINFEEILKFVIIGDRAVGKTLFVNKFLGAESNTSEYKPTGSLEIKKGIRKIFDKNIKIELWDTNISILNSPIIKSKNII